MTMYMVFIGQKPALGGYVLHIHRLNVHYILCTMAAILAIQEQVLKLPTLGFAQLYVLCFSSKSG